MSNLSERVKKANDLVFVDTPGTRKTMGGCWGSKGDRYTVSLFQKKEFEQVAVADKIVNAAVVTCTCQVLNVANGQLDPMEDCKGNIRHTICYHCLGYLKHKLAQRGKTISFYQDILGALNGLNFGGQLTKVISKQGYNFVWAVVRDKAPDVIKVEEEEEDKNILSAQENISLMRGDDDEGID
jgi:hypothetical protein